MSRYKLDEYLQLFDFPNPSISAEKRFTTTVPLQRLFLMNSDFMQIAGRGTRRSGLRPSLTIAPANPQALPDRLWPRALEKEIGLGPGVSEDRAAARVRRRQEAKAGKEGESRRPRPPGRSLEGRTRQREAGVRGKRWTERDF